MWALDMVRKCLFNAKDGEDPYDAVVNYIRTTLILDLVATAPQLASGMGWKWTVLKNIRLYQISLLHFPVEILIEKWYTTKDDNFVQALVYAFGTCF